MENLVDTQVRLLGELQIIHDARVLELGGYRQQCVLAVLLTNHGATVARDRIAEWAWPADPPSSVADLIANYVSRLRHVLKPIGERIQLRARQPGFTALLDSALVDTHCFSALLQQARVAHAGQDYELASARLREALALWRGEPLAGLDTPYLQQQRATFEAQRLSAVELLARLELDIGHPERAVEHLRAVPSIEATNESLATLLVQAMTAAGDGTGAADLAARTVRLMHEQGRAPGQALREAHSDALAGRRPHGTPRPPGARRQLPTSTRAFTGRGRELTQLLRLADNSQDGASLRAVVISTIDGMPGIGKTALAVEAAHRLADRFTDGQLFIDLHGYTAGLEPQGPGDALERFLRSLGVPAPQIPRDLDSKAALYRDRLAGTKTLIILDNAASSTQVRPLLPGAPGCLVVVTSRRHLAGLDDAHALTLESLPETDAIALFHKVATPGRVSANDPLIPELMALCGYTPLAIRIIAARLRHQATLRVGQVIGQLRSEQGRLHRLRDEDRDLTAVFDLSFTRLTGEEQRMFRLLGLIPGADFDAYAAANLAQFSREHAEQILDCLLGNNLLLQHTAGRYRFHDLVRLYARTLAEAPGHDANASRRALDRLWDYYIHAAHAADQCAEGISLLDTATMSGPVHTPPRFDDPAYARTWLAAETLNMDAAAHYVVVDHSPAHGIAVPADPIRYWAPGGRWRVTMALHQAAYAAALPPGDQLPRTGLLAELLTLQRNARDVGHVQQVYSQAIAFYQARRDLLGHARASLVVGSMDVVAGQHEVAIEHLTRAADLYLHIEHRIGQALSLTYLGAALRITGAVERAEATLLRAAELSQAAGLRVGEIAALTQLGIAKRERGALTDAETILTQALDYYSVQDKRNDFAGTLTHLAQTHHLAGRIAQAEAGFTHALEILAEVGDPGGQATTFNYQAAMALACGDPERARALHLEALSLARQINASWDQANALAGIGATYAAQSHPSLAERHDRQAMTLYQAMGCTADAARMQRTIDNAQRA